MLKLFKKTTLNQNAAAAKSTQSCPTLCDPMDGSPPGSPVPGILQARTLEWLAISFSSAWKWKVKVKLLSCVWLLATPRTAAYQAPPSMGFARQEYWSGLPLPKNILNQNKCRAKLYSWIRRINIVKIWILPQEFLWTQFSCNQNYSRFLWKLSRWFYI